MPKANNVTPRKSYRRKHNLSRIKQDVTYDFHEISLLLDVSKGTVRHWEKEGLPVMKFRRPYLVKGSELKAFLSKRQSRIKHTCKEHEIYCLSCKVPRCAWENAVDVKAVNEKKLMLSGICSTCDRSLSKIQPMKNLPHIAEIFNIQQWHNSHIIARMHPHLNYHFKEVVTSP